MAFMTCSIHRLHHLFPNISFFLILSFFITTTTAHLLLPSSPPLTASVSTIDDPLAHHGCHSIDTLPGGHAAKCSYLQSHRPCSLRSYIDYLHIFYCLCGRHPLLGYTLLSLWLLLLFYLLGNTASRYFCSNLEGLSKLLDLPPTVAGVTLLALGNGAPDVFASIVSFAAAGRSGGVVGLSSVLGGALFVSTVVVGIITISIASRSVRIDRCSFLRDICFLLAVLCSLLTILLIGRINLLGSIFFCSIYIVYVLLVSVAQCWRIKKGGDLESPMLERTNAEEPAVDYSPSSSCFFMDIIKLPLTLPRRLTIPDVAEERWSKPFAVASATLSPVLLAALCNSKIGDIGLQSSRAIFMAGGLVGLVLGITAMVGTDSSAPPKRCLLPWLAGGFLMSVTWTYITAQELVGLLVSMGHILSISPEVLGVTVMAWGNSVGDLMANVAMAVNGGQDGAQIAISGCYAGPIFNTLVGLGLSLVFSSWSAPLVITQESGHYQTLGFMVVGLLWAAVVLTRRRMKLDRVLGIGLLGIYLCFLCIRIAESIGMVEIRLW